MRACVFADEALKKQAGRFVWLSIDTEREGNAAFIAKYPIEQWPSLFIIDAATEQVALKWLGTATVSQMEKLLDDGERAVRGSAGNAAEEALAKADRLYGEGRAAEAALAYKEAIARAPADWARRARTIESAIIAFQTSGANQACAKLAMEQVLGLSPGPSYANAAATGLQCALAAAADLPWRKTAVAVLEPLVRRSLDSEGILADDRSGLYETLVETCKDRGDVARAKETASKWLVFLESERSKARSVEARASFDPHLTAAAIESGDPAHAVPALLETEKELPGDYNAPARLAALYREMGQFDDALAAADRALAKAYGPRKVRVYETKATIQQKKGDVAGAKRTLQEAIAFVRTLPAAYHSEQLIARLEKSLAKAQ
jgi:tetratricopeptide (TPR) repeat protein